MATHLDASGPETDEEYFEERPRSRSFDSALLREPVTVLPTRTPLVSTALETATEGMRAMRRERRGCILITDDGTTATPLRGIFTERDVLLRIIDCGRNPATLQLGELMTEDPECLPVDGKVAWVLNMMSVGGFRHVPVVDELGRPHSVVSMRDVVQFMVETFPTEILNLPPGFDVARYRTRDGA
jgi:signal-transduction protein with cAMP-binding, CBS, and nucleotidyltransferase domain